MKHIFFMSDAAVWALGLADSQWYIMLSLTQLEIVSLLSNSVITSFLLILNVENGFKKRYSIILFKDSLPADHFRYLLSMLKTIE